MIKMVLDGKLFCPQVFCDQCGGRIVSSGNGLYLTGRDGPVTGELFFTHKDCNLLFEHLHPPADEESWYWLELRELPLQLAANLGMGDTREEIAEKLCGVVVQRPGPAEQEEERQQKAEAFEELCDLEPRLRELYEEAKAIRDDGSKPSFCANEVWHGTADGPGPRDRLLRLVGWEAGTPDPVPNVLDIPEQITILTAADLMKRGEDDETLARPVDPRLRTTEAYDVAYEMIYAALPNCRNCNCA